MQAAEAPTVSVVMPTYNRQSNLEEVVLPLLEEPLLELIVVVDGSRDGSLELLQSIGHPLLKPLWIENSGEMGAREAGARAAQGEVVLFVDDDVRAHPGIVAGHARRHRGDRLVVVGYMPVPPPARDFATRIYAREYEAHCVACEREPARVLTHLWGGNFSMRRDDCLAVGMRNPSYTERYHPDREFGLRCVEAGLQGVFDRTLQADHLHERTLDAFVRDARSQGAARVQLHRLHPDLLGPFDPGMFERGLPAPARLTVRWPHALRMLLIAAGRLRLRPIEEIAARLLRRAEQRRGAARTLST